MKRVSVKEEIVYLTFNMIPDWDECAAACPDEMARKPDFTNYEIAGYGPGGMKLIRAKFYWIVQG
jgi:hypothetical protein